MDAYAAERQQIVQASQALVAKGLLMATGGNVSVRVGPDAFAITPSNYDYGRMTAEDVCVLDLQLNVRQGALKPSVESGLHAGVYAARADVNAVVHTHQVYASALALVRAPIPALFDEQVRFLGRSVEIVPYAPSGTGFLKGNLVRALKNHHNAYILQNHGVVCLGPDLERAMHNAEIVEKCALAYLLALCTERPVTKVPLPIREIAFAKLRQDQQRAERGEARTGGE